MNDMRTGFFLASILLITILNACGQSPEQTRSQADFDKMLDEMYERTVPLIKTELVSQQSPDSFIILDTREKEEFEVSHIPGAIWVGYDNLQTDKLKTLDKEKPVLVYCSVGYRSERVGEKLQDMGFKDVQNLYGGIFDWKHNGQTVIDSLGKSTERVHTYNKMWSQWLRVGEKVY